MNLSVDFLGVNMKNPITTASGTFGSGMEFNEYTDISKLGAVTTKGVAVEPWEGNCVPRVCETPSGMLNAIGLQNPGADVFIKRDLEFLKQFDTNIIVNICGHSEEEYLACIDKMNDTDADIFEINISCPNVKSGGIAFGTDPKMVEHITNIIKQRSKKPIIMKLSPNVTDIKVMAKAAEAGGADAISLINTITGMKIDIHKRSFALANKTGGLSGPAIRPVAVRMVYEASSAVSIPVLGMGGIRTAEDAIEMMMAGATMVAVGTANFNNPIVTSEIIDGIKRFMEEQGISDIKDIIGIV